MNLRFSVCILSALLLGFCRVEVRAVEPEVAEISFLGSPRTNSLPAWVRSVDQEGGSFADGAWVVTAAAARGVGRLSITIDRQNFNEDLALVIDCQGTNSDLTVQLFDGQNRVVVLDLFGNVLTVGSEAKTDSFIVPLRKYPSASKIVLRRISGPIKVSSVMLFPVVTEAFGDPETLQELAKLLGDPVSPGANWTRTNSISSSGTLVTNQTAATRKNGNQPPGTEPGISSSGAFTASSMNSSCFAIVGIHQAQFKVHQDSVEVWLKRADLYYRNVSTNTGARQIESIKVGLATLTGQDCRWSIGLKSESVPVNVVMRPEERQVLRDLHFTIPKSQTMDLSQHWLVFELLETHPESSDQRPGTTYAHSSKDVFVRR